MDPVIPFCGAGQSFFPNPGRFFMSSYTHELVQKSDRLPVHFSLNTGSVSTIPAHWHEYVELIFLLEGHMTAVIQAETYHLTEGDFLIINSGDLHMTQIPEPTTAYILLQIPENELLKLLPHFETLRFQTLIQGAYSGPGAYLTEMLREYEAKESGYQLLFLARLYELIYMLYRNYSSRPALSSDSADRDLKRITQVMDWIQKNYREPLTLNEAADFVGLSREYFCRMFKKCTGQTFLEYLNAERAMHLYDSLRESDKNLTLLMEEHGITNYKVFMRAFKHLYGRTPQQVRSQYRQRAASSGF
jgi:AraC-like DNA-binding protein/mannose-6-phosphate isomerase-like protein (cupin superfamily)